MNYRIYLLFIFIFLGHISLGQEYTSKKDTVYVFLMQSTLDNGRPVATFLVKSNLTFLKNAFKNKTTNEIVCTAISQSILFEEPALTFDFRKYHFKNIAEADSCYGIYLKEISPIAGSYVPFKTAKLSDGKIMHMSITKISGDFWVLHFNGNSFSSESFEINNCYNWDKWYNLKKLDKLLPLTQPELDSIRKFIAVR